VNPEPQIPGYDFGQRLLQHPLAEIWRGRSRTGLEVVAIVLSDTGAADPQVRERLDHASRSAALKPGRFEAPLWAANFTADRPYAITQLIPGQTGAERLLDPLDGVFGNDQDSINEVRLQLQQFGAAPVPPQGPDAYGEPQQPAYAVPEERSYAVPEQGSYAVPEQGSYAVPEQGSYYGQVAPGPVAIDGGGSSVAPGATAAGSSFIAQFKQRAGWRFYPGMVLAYLFLFSLTYSVGAVLNKTDSDAAPGKPSPVPVAVTPAALPTPVVLPGITKLKAVRLQPGLPQVSVVGVAYENGADAQTVNDLGLPFAFRWPVAPGKIVLGESSYSIYRRVIVGEDPRAASLDAEIAVHPCKDRAACLAERPEFDQRWTKRYKAPVPVTPKDDAQTWYTEQQAAAGGKPYAVSMTRAFRSGDEWWLVGVVITAKPGDEAAAQRVLNDIRTQTS
jgi:hypothetical protein